ISSLRGIQRIAATSKILSAPGSQREGRNPQLNQQ
ncbi:GRP isoform 4, partial [Pan troglodytes]